MTYRAELDGPLRRAKWEQTSAFGHRIFTDEAPVDSDSTAFVETSAKMES